MKLVNFYVICKYFNFINFRYTFQIILIIASTIIIIGKAGLLFSMLPATPLLIPVVKKIPVFVPAPIPLPYPVLKKILVPAPVSVLVPIEKPKKLLFLRNYS